MTTTPNTRQAVCRVSDRFFEGSIMQFAVWITLSDGGRSRFGIYDSWAHAEAIAWAVGGVVELV